LAINYTEGIIMIRKFVLTDCVTNISPDCTKTFQREIKRGRPRINCDACLAFKPTAEELAAKLQRTCPCGTSFTIKQGRGRKADKCDACRNIGVVYRRDDSGNIQTLSKSEAAREYQVTREQAAKERAMLLKMSMDKLVAKTDRVVIHH
jgi:hypothetical protein